MEKKAEKKRKDLWLLAGMVGLLVLFNLSMLPFVFHEDGSGGINALFVQDDSPNQNSQQNSLEDNIDNKALPNAENLVAVNSGNDGRRSSGGGTGGSSGDSSDSDTNSNSDGDVVVGDDSDSDNENNNPGENEEDNSNNDEESDNSNDEDELPGFTPPPPNESGPLAEEFNGGTFNVGIGGLG